MNSSLITILLWSALVLGHLAAAFGTVRVIRNDRRPTSDVAWADWREDQLRRNLRVS